MKIKKQKKILYALLGAAVLASLAILEMTYKIPNDRANMTYAERVVKANDFFPPTDKECRTVAVNFGGVPKEYLTMSEVLDLHLNRLAQKILSILTHPECYF